MSTFFSELQDFDGHAPLFPLPNLVMFPRVVQPLHIFEPRYREMIADAIADNRLIATALISPGSTSTGIPPLFPHVCIGRITSEDRLEDGRYNILLQGLCRGRILHELQPNKQYRVASIEPLSDQSPQDFAPSEEGFRDEILKRLTLILQQRGNPEMQHLIHRENIPLGVLADILAYSSGLHPLEAQRLLGEPDVRNRVVYLLRLLGTFTSPDPRKAVESAFPPPFSLN